MINFKLFNIRSILIIGIVTVAVHILAKPLYNRIDSATGD